MNPHITAMLVVAALVAAMIAAIARMIATSEQPEDVAVVELVDADDFAVERAEPFTDHAVGVASVAKAGRHYHDTVEFVALDYLIPRAYPTLIAPRLHDARRAVSE